MTRGEIYENMLVAFDTLRAHKVRSALTVIGIVIGVTSVISVASIIEGLNGYIAHRVEEMGSRAYYLSRFPMSAGFGRIPESVRRRKYLDPSDAQYLRESCPSLETVSPFGARPVAGDPTTLQVNEIRYGGQLADNVILRGVEPELGVVIPLFAVAHGRFVTQFDMDRTRDVIVIGDAIANSLFPNVDPIGKVARLNGRNFEVIGVFEKDPGLFGGPGMDQIAAIPFSSFRKHYPEIREFFIAFVVHRDVSVEAGKNEVIEAMRRRRRVPYHGENDFDIFSPDFLSNLWSQLTGALVALTSVISSVGLLVGGIGVMNIMLISVTERTTEIGVRKAIGARRSDIRAQFLIEATTLSLTGGIIGILLGAAVATLVRTLLPYVPATLSPLWIALGVTISVGVGLFFGYYPANRAAALDPIVCLRYE
ncbi:MAG: ABC transporter permease [Bryobacteraceae bacterium]|nr:ABC transporter permease [Bryobacteraceae bacterium]